MRTHKGRIDLTVETATDAYIIEVKRDSTAKKAIEQIQAKECTDRFRPSGKPITLFGMSFSTIGQKHRRRKLMLPMAHQELFDAVVGRYALDIAPLDTTIMFKASLLAHLHICTLKGFSPDCQRPC